MATKLTSVSHQSVHRKMSKMSTQKLARVIKLVLLN